MVEVWFIRHGESVANAGGMTKNISGIPLTPKGAEQAKAASLLINAPPALIIMSPYIRTQLTAQPTIDRFPAARREIWPVQEFTYLPDSMYRDTLGADRIPFREAFWAKKNPAHRNSAATESFSDLLQRARDTIARLQQEEQGPIIVFAHAFFLHALRRVAEEPRLDDHQMMSDFVSRYKSARIDNCEILKATVDAEGLHLLPPAPPMSRAATNKPTL